jgi:hypothetical protein
MQRTLIAAILLPLESLPSPKVAATDRTKTIFDPVFIALDQLTQLTIHFIMGFSARTTTYDLIRLTP